ncbi:MAG: hypothetical protein KDC98_15995 [Planctomycetes bacterium]|nr:hypothetical protein [Planctomycetota bacterium]
MVASAVLGCENAGAHIEMNRLVRNRFLLCVLIALLQVAMLPGQGRLRCMLRSHSLTCCCAHHQTASPAGPSGETQSGCCAGRAKAPACCGKCPAPVPPGPGPGESTGGDEPDPDCHCGDGAGPPLLGFSADVDAGVAKELAPVWLPLSHVPWAVVAAAGGGRFVAARVIPRARTGPPLFVLFESFLI